MMRDIMSIVIDLTTVIALWGAILATILAIYGYLERYPRLKVEHGTPIIMGDTVTPPHVVFLIQGTNYGKRSILVLSYGICVGKKKN